MVDQLASDLGRPDLAMMVARGAFRRPRLSADRLPDGRMPASTTASWTMIHAIIRQESQFDRARSAVPTPAADAVDARHRREQATKLGIGYSRLLADEPTTTSARLAYFRGSRHYGGAIRSPSLPITPARAT